MSSQRSDIVLLHSLISGGFVNNIGKRVVLCVRVCVWMSKCGIAVCVCSRVLVTPHWSMGPYTALLISEGNQTFLKLLSSGLFVFFTLILSA